MPAASVLARHRACRERRAAMAAFLLVFDERGAFGAAGFARCDATGCRLKAADAPLPSSALMDAKVG
jgi:hypothetical protein